MFLVFSMSIRSRLLLPLYKRDICGVPYVEGFFRYRWCMKYEMPVCTKQSKAQTSSVKVGVGM